MTNRIASSLRMGSGWQTACTCEWPLCVAVANVAREAKPPGFILLSVTTHYDCLLCGPFSQSRTICVEPSAVRAGAVLPVGHPGRP